MKSPEAKTLRNSKIEDTKSEKSKTKTPLKKQSEKPKKATPKKPTPIKTDPKTDKSSSKQKDVSKSTEAAVSDKQKRFLKFQKWQNRAGPSAPGSKEVPQVRR